ncbi:unnamed protein product [Phytophthora fragariaefolia]|uniref:Unnamed protein product n=1 Tax=Phytophthora fragariaefolia TaxID=1490495 RepID=A0A9W6XL49_9STRA|nr:unnamed protein product [Phytophthora fragariaefolia]
MLRHAMLTMVPDTVNQKHVANSGSDLRAELKNDGRSTYKGNFNTIGSNTVEHSASTRSDEATSSDDQDVLLLWLVHRTYLPYRERILVPDFRLNILAMSDGEARDQFRFTVGELTLLAQHPKLPAVIRTPEGVRSTPLEALAVWLRRLIYPKRWIDLAAMFGRAPSTLCHIFYYVVEFLDDNLVEFLYFDTERITRNLECYCAAISAKAPGSIEGVWSFIDGTVRPICRTSKGQQAMYNGHKRVHATKFQTLVTPDGLISHLFGPVDGRRHDMFMLNKSGLKRELETNPAFHNKLIYGDPAYGCTNLFCCPYKGCRVNAPPEGTQQGYECCARIGGVVVWRNHQVFFVSGLQASPARRHHTDSHVIQARRFFSRTVLRSPGVATTTPDTSTASRRRSTNTSNRN